MSDYDFKNWQFSNLDFDIVAYHHNEITGDNDPIWLYGFCKTEEECKQEILENMQDFPEMKEWLNKVEN